MTSTKKLLLVSKFSEQADSYTYASSFERELRARGYQVIIFNTKKNYLLLPYASHDHLPWWLKRLNNLIVNSALLIKVYRIKPMTVFCIKAENISYRTMRLVRALVARLVLFYPDNPFSWWNSNSNEHVIKSLPLYDDVLIWSHQLVVLLRAIGCRRVHYFPFAVERALYKYPVNTIPESYRSEVCFVGTWDIERELWLSQLKQLLPDLDLALWGNGWYERIDKKHVLYTSLRGKAVYGLAMRQVFAGSGIVLNFIRLQNLDAHNMRTYEVVASGAILLTQRTIEQIKPPFYEGVNIWTFSTIDELVFQIQRLLEKKQFIESQKSKIIDNDLFYLDFWIKPLF